MRTELWRPPRDEKRKTKTYELTRAVVDWLKTGSDGGEKFVIEFDGERAEVRSIHALTSLRKSRLALREVKNKG